MNKLDNDKNKLKFYKNKKYIIIFIVVLLILASIFGIYKFLKNEEFKKYAIYEKKMNAYSLNYLYNNSSAKTSEYVKNAEAIKVIIGSVLNTNNITTFSPDTLNDNSNLSWLKYANQNSMIPNSLLNQKEYNKKITYIDAIKYLAAAKNKLLQKNLDDQNDIKIKNYDKLTDAEKRSVLDMISNGIIEDSSKNFNKNKKVFKGLLNELIVKFVEKYNIIYPEGEKLVQDQSKVPSNVDEYPYIVESVDKSVYEIPFNNQDTPDFISPIKSFKNQKEYYNENIKKIEKYYDTILNVDYTNVNVKYFKALNEISLNTIDDTTIENYVSYVKENNIKIEGTSKSQIPIIYYDGDSYRIRTKIQFKVISSKVNKNILYNDLTTNNVMKYEFGREYSFYVDACMGLRTAISGSRALFVDNNYGIEDIILNKENSGIKFEY